MTIDFSIVCPDYRSRLYRKFPMLNQEYILRLQKAEKWGRKGIPGFIFSQNLKLTTACQFPEQILH